MTDKYIKLIIGAETVEEIRDLITKSNEEAVREFLEWYAKDYPDGVWRDGDFIIDEYLKENEKE